MSIKAECVRTFTLVAIGPDGNTCGAFCTVREWALSRRARGRSDTVFTTHFQTFGEAKIAADLWVDKGEL